MSKCSSSPHRQFNDVQAVVAEVGNQIVFFADLAGRQGDLFSHELFHFLNRHPCSISSRTGPWFPARTQDEHERCRGTSGIQPEVRGPHVAENKGNESATARQPLQMQKVATDIGPAPELDGKIWSRRPRPRPHGHGEGGRVEDDEPSKVPPMGIREIQPTDGNQADDLQDVPISNSGLRPVLSTKRMAMKVARKLTSPIHDGD